MNTTTTIDNILIERVSTKTGKTIRVGIGPVSYPSGDMIGLIATLDGVVIGTCHTLPALPAAYLVQIRKDCGAEYSNKIGNCLITTEEEALLNAAFCNNRKPVNPIAFGSRCRVCGEKLVPSRVDYDYATADYCGCEGD